MAQRLRVDTLVVLPPVTEGEVADMEEEEGAVPHMGVVLLLVTAEALAVEAMVVVGVVGGLGAR
jgi:hypothetical protein